jgi:hypothetical protein
MQALERSIIESQAIALIGKHVPTGTLQDGETVVVQWTVKYIGFVVRNGSLVPVCPAEIIRSKPADLRQHIIMEAREADEETESEDDNEDDRGNGGWISGFIDWIKELASSGTVSGTGTEPSPPPLRPGFPPPPNPPLIPPLRPDPTNPTSEPASGGIVTFTIFRW